MSNYQSQMAWLSSPLLCQEEWNNLDQNELRRLVHSVPNQCREVI